MPGGRKKRISPERERRDDGMNAETILGILIPFAGTSLGAALVFVLRKSISENLQKILT